MHGNVCCSFGFPEGSEGFFTVSCSFPSVRRFPLKPDAR